MIVCGIDPGVTGAVCFIKGKEVTLYKMPETVREIRNLLKPYAARLEDKYYVEKVHSSPQMGASTAYKFGRVFGWIEGILADMDAKFVPPQHWQAAVDCFTGGDKHVSFRRAKELFPDLKGLTLKTADAALIAYYGWLKEGKPI